MNKQHYITPSMIIEATGLSRATVYRHLKRLGLKNHGVSDRAPRYAPADVGKHFVQFSDDKSANASSGWPFANDETRNAHINMVNAMEAQIDEDAESRQTIRDNPDIFAD